MNVKLNGVKKIGYLPAQVISSLFFLIISFCGFAQEAKAESLNVLVSGITSGQGQLIIHLYDSSKGFPSKPELSVFEKKVPVVGQEMWIQMGQFKPGTYAMVVTQDNNLNDKLDTNFLGIPKEPVGVSGDDGGFPRYKKSMFQITDPNGFKELRIRLKELF